MSEQVLFNEKGVLVSRNRIAIGGNTYPVRSIASVTTTNTGRGDFGPGCAVVILAFVSFLAALAFLAASGYEEYWPVIWQKVYWIIALLICLAILVKGIRIMFFSKPSYFIWLNMVDGGKAMMSTQDIEYHQRILRAINNVITT